MTDKRSYEELPSGSREETLGEIASGESLRVVRALIGAALESDESSWVEACAVSLSLVDDEQVRRAALLALGHLARRFGRLDGGALSVVVRRLEAEEGVAGAVADLKDDLTAYGVEY